MAEIIHSKKALAVNPLKVSQPIGASLAFLGLARSLPLMHGSQGCTAFGKVFFVRHFREPIPLQTTAMDQVSSIMGADENVIEALRTLSDKSKPDIIGLVTTGLSETQGTDIRRCLHEFPHRVPGVRPRCCGAGQYAGLRRLPGKRLRAGHRVADRNAGAGKPECAASGRSRSMCWLRPC